MIVVLTCTQNANGVCVGRWPNKSRFTYEALETTANAFRWSQMWAGHKFTGLKSQGGKLHL